MALDIPALNVPTNTGWEDALQYSLCSGWDNLITDCLSINVNIPGMGYNQQANRIGYISTELAPDTINLPIGGTFLGYRFVLPAKHRDRADYMCSVVLFEQYPDQGRIWRNTYNGDSNSWSGWACCAPTYDIWPLGATYMSIYPTSPASLFGGTWTQIYDRVLIAAGSAYVAQSTGGEATHKLTTAEIPSHTHNVGVDYDGMGSGNNSGAATVHKAGISGSYRQVATSSNGSNVAHNNIPPYYAVYIWIRTA